MSVLVNDIITHNPSSTVNMNKRPGRIECDKG